VCSGGSRTEHAGDHGDLAGMPDGVLNDSFEHYFVGIVAAGERLGQIFGREIANALFEEIAALVPTGDELVPRNGRLSPLLFGVPTGEGIGFGGDARPFVPEEQVLKQGGNGMCAGNGRRGGEVRRDLR